MSNTLCAFTRSSVTRSCDGESGHALGLAILLFIHQVLNVLLNSQSAHMIAAISAHTPGFLCNSRLYELADSLAHRPTFLHPPTDLPAHALISLGNFQPDHATPYLSAYTQAFLCNCER